MANDHLTISWLNSATICIGYGNYEILLLQLLKLFKIKLQLFVVGDFIAHFNKIL